MTESPASSTARRSLLWGIICVVVGAILVASGSDLYGWAVEKIGGDLQAGVHLLNIVTTLARVALVPLGAVLIGAAIVIRALAPERREAGGLHQ